MNKLFDKENVKYIVADFETESLSLLSARPWECAWIVVENDKITAEYQKFPFIHDLNVSEGAARVTRFDYKEYKQKSEKAIDVYNLLEPYLYNKEYYIIGQNIIPYDLFIWKNFQKYCGKKVDYSIVSRMIDTKMLGKAFQLGIEFPKNFNDMTPWMYRINSIRKKGLKASNESLAKLLDVNYDPNKAHSGIEDIKVTNEIFKKLANKMNIWGY